MPEAPPEHSIDWRCPGILRAIVAALKESDERAANERERCAAFVRSMKDGALVRRGVKYTELLETIAQSIERADVI
jgi:hypothetical protein